MITPQNPIDGLLAGLFLILALSLCFYYIKDLKKRARKHSITTSNEFLKDRKQYWDAIYGKGKYKKFHTFLIWLFLAIFAALVLVFKIFNPY